MGRAPSRGCGWASRPRAPSPSRGTFRSSPCPVDAAALAILLDDALADPYAEARRFAVVTDARRREVAYSVYEGMDADGLPIRATGPALALRTDIDAVLSAQEAGVSM
jgi:hypothetical protein